MLEKMLTWLDKQLLLVLLILCLLRLAFLFSSGLVLVGDESYYWDWSRHPDWCYFSKPPMVAWLIGMATGLFGDYAPVVRIPAVLLSTLFLWYFHATTQLLYGRRAAGFAVLMLLATPNNVLANLFMTIDPPLYCFWMMCIYYLAQALFAQRQRSWWWAGCAGALALLSKQVALLLPLVLLVYLLLDKQRHVWLKKQFWWFLMPMLLAMLPILIWNQQHDWVMYGHSKNHFTAPEAASILVNLINAAKVWCYQLLFMSPILCGLLFWLSVNYIINFKQLTSEQQFLTLLGPVLLLGVLLLSLKQKIQGNWPLPFYFTGLILLAGAWQAGRWKTWLDYGVKLGFGLVLLTYSLPGLLKITHLQDTRLDPIKRFRYWETIVNDIAHYRQQAVTDLEHSFVLALGHRNLASETAFYLPDHPQVYRFEADGSIVSQYELWSGPQESHQGEDALIISDADHPVPDAIKQAFLNLRFVAEVANPKQKNMPYALYLGEHLQHWPSPLLQPTTIEESL